VTASSWLALGDLARGRGDAARARECYQEAAKVAGLTPEQQSAVQERLGNR
jgi:lipopolysaccharide biosynthesis regulator YciM